MKQKIEFAKMHGLGNDYIYVDIDKYPIADVTTFSRKMSPRHYAIGSDGVVTISKAPSGRYRMGIFNADGSEALMCGNAIRCVGKYLYERGMVQSDELEIETLSGVKSLKLYVEENGVVKRVRVDMNPPVYIHPLEALRLSNGSSLMGMPVSVGNPHWVSIVDEPLECFELEKYGTEVECDPRFEDRTNFEIVRIVSPDVVQMRVWERGSGITLACGTGACATAVALIQQGLVNNSVEVQMPGGSLLIEWGGVVEDTLYMTGDATLAYEGVVWIE